MRWCIQAEQHEHIDVPHAIGSQVKCASVLKLVLLCVKIIIISPLPLAFSHLAHNEKDDGHSRTQKCDKHQELEPVDDSL